MKTYMVFLMVGVVVAAHGAEKKKEEPLSEKASEKYKRPKAIDVAAADAALKEQLKKVEEKPKLKDSGSPLLVSTITPQVNWRAGSITKHQDKA